MPAPVIIVEYDSRWPALYEEERDLILSAVGEWIVAIEHVGSTAVPGLGGKRIIDIMPAVRHLADVEHCIEPLERIDYEYVPEYNEILPERRYFRKGPPEAGSFHLHVTERTSEFWERHLLFRDFLRTHPGQAQEYYLLKKELADRYGRDRDGYTEAKTAFIEGIVARARRGLERGS